MTTTRTLLTSLTLAGALALAACSRGVGPAEHGRRGE